MDLSIADEQYPAAVRRERWVSAFGDAPGGPSAGAYSCDDPFCAVGVARGVSDPTVAVWRVTSYENDRRPVVGQRHIRHVVAVVSFHCGQFDRFEIGTGGSVHIAHATLIRNPGNPLSSLRGGYLDRVGRVKNLLNRVGAHTRRLPSGGGGSSRDNHKNRDEHAQDGSGYGSCGF